MAYGVDIRKNSLIYPLPGGSQESLPIIELLRNQKIESLKCLPCNDHAKFIVISIYKLPK